MFSLVVYRFVTHEPLGGNPNNAHVTVFGITFTQILYNNIYKFLVIMCEA